MTLSEIRGTPTLQHLMHLYDPLDSRFAQMKSFSDLISATRACCFASRYSSSLSRILQIWAVEE